MSLKCYRRSYELRFNGEHAHRSSLFIQLKQEFDHFYTIPYLNDKNKLVQSKFRTRLYDLQHLTICCIRGNKWFFITQYRFNKASQLLLNDSLRYNKVYSYQLESFNLYI